MSILGGEQEHLSQVSPKLLFLVPRFHTNMIGWVEALKERGVEVSLIAIRREFSEDHFLVAPIVIPSFLNNYIHRMPISSSLKRKFTSPKFSTILQECKKIDPDKTVIRFELDLTSLKFLLAIRFLGKPTFIYTQWPVKNAPFLKSFLLKLIKLVFRTPIFSPVYQVSYSALHLAKINSFDFLDHKLELEKRLAERSTIRWVPFTLSKDYSSFSLKSNEFGFKAINFLTIGKFTERKNLQQILEVFCQNESFLLSNSTLTIIGECTTLEHHEVFGALANMLNEDELIKKVQIISNIPHKFIQEYLSKSDVFILQSRREPASISIIEAMACGNILLLDSQSGTADYPGFNYGAFPINSKEDLKNAINYLLNENTFIPELQVRNLETFAAFFDSTFIGDLLYEFLFKE